MRGLPVAWAAAASITGIFWLAAVAVPLLALVLAGAPGVTGAEIREALFDSVTLRIARVTFFQAAASAALSAAVGLPLGLWAAGNRWALRFFSVPFAAPTVVTAAAAIAVLGRRGWLSSLGLQTDLLYSMETVIGLHVFLNAPWIASRVAQAVEATPAARWEAARTLGASRLARFRFVLWPESRGALLASLAQVYALCAGSFALVTLLGGGPPVETLETAIFSRIRQVSVDWAGATACALWQLVVTLAPWAVASAWLDDAATRAGGRDPSAGLRPLGERLAASRGAGGWARAGVIACGALALAFAAPYLTVLSGWLRHPVPFVGGSSDEIWRALRISLALAAVTALASTGLGAAAAVVWARLAARSRALGRVVAVAFCVPSGISTLALGLGLWLAYRRWIDPFDGSFAAMAALQAALFFPFAFRAFAPLAASPRQRLLEAAATLGASPARAVLAVEWPRWRPVVFSVLALAAGASIGEVAAVSLFYSEELVPLPLVLGRWLGQYRFEDAAAVAGLLFALSAGIAALGAAAGRVPSGGSSRLEPGGSRMNEWRGSRA